AAPAACRPERLPVSGGKAFRPRHGRPPAGVPPRRHAGALDPPPPPLQPPPQSPPPLLHIRHTHIITWGGSYEGGRGRGGLSVPTSPGTTPRVHPHRQELGRQPWRAAATARAGPGGRGTGAYPVP